MANALNKLQGERLLSIMVQNQNVAHGYHISIKNKYEKCWNFIEDELNSLGPPFKSLAEWKKTWSDQKRYILKRKNSANLTPIEMAVYRMFTEGARRNSYALHEAQSSSTAISSAVPTERHSQNHNNNNNTNNNNGLDNLIPYSGGNKVPQKRIKLEVEENDTVAYNNNLYNITVLNEAEISENESDSNHNDNEPQQRSAQHLEKEKTADDFDGVNNQPHHYYENFKSQRQRRQMPYYHRHHNNEINDQFNDNDNNDNDNDHDDLYGVEDVEPNEFSSLDEEIYQNHTQRHSSNSNNSNSNNNNDNHNSSNNNATSNNNSNNNIDMNFMGEQEHGNESDMDEVELPSLHLLTTSRPASLKAASIAKTPTTKPIEHNCCIGHDVTHTLKDIGSYLEKLYSLEMGKLREMKRHNRVIESLRRQEIHFKSFKRKFKKD